MSICQIYDLCAETLWLGRYGENGARDIAIDVGRWFADLGAEGTVVLVNWRPGEDDTPYNPVITVDGSRVVWSPSNIDLAISGRGFAELRYYVGDALAKSKTFRTVIDRTPSEGTNPPSASEDWVERMEQAAVDAVEASASAMAAEETAVEAKNTAVEAAETAANAKDVAVQAANTATNSEQIVNAKAAEVLQMTTQAVEAADEATSAAQTATEQATAAETAAGRAEIAATSAESSGNVAMRASTAAASSALTAQTAGQTATAKAQEATEAAAEAKASETAAKASETNAAQSATAAANAQTAAQNAQTGAENAQTAAESAQAAAEQAAASVTASAEQIETNRQDISNVKADFLQLPDNGVTANAKQLLSESGTDNTEPYMFRAVPVNADRAELDAVVGGTVAWNQLIGVSATVHTETKNGVTITDNRDGSYSISTASGGATANVFFFLRNVSLNVVKDHKYLYRGCPTGGSNTTYRSYIINSVENKNDIGGGVVQNATGTGATVCIIAYIVSGTVISTPLVFRPQLFDLTQTFGSTIADYIYNLETATPGAGVAWFRKLFPADYYPYDAGTLKSVEGVSAKVTRDADNNVLGTYPLDPTVVLRGIPKLSNGKLTYDGDRYLPNGTVERRYGIVDLGTLRWMAYAGYPGLFYTNTTEIPFKTPASNVVIPNAVMAHYQACISRDIGNAGYTKGYFALAANRIYVADDTYDGDPPAFNAAMSGVYMVYELATSTTETATPYQSLQVCDPNGTEEFVTTGIVPVGHETFYPENLRAKIEGLPWDFSTLIAPTEAGTASRNYTVGSLLIMGNVLYKVTANIANGGTITPGANCTATTLSEVISALS